MKNHIKLGTATLPKGSSTVVVSVNFDNPFEDSNYEVLLTTYGRNYVEQMKIVEIYVAEKTKNGFKIYGYSNETFDYAVTKTWVAIHL